MTDVELVELKHIPKDINQAWLLRCKVDELKQHFPAHTKANLVAWLRELREAQPPPEATEPPHQKQKAQVDWEQRYKEAVVALQQLQHADAFYRALQEDEGAPFRIPIKGPSKKGRACAFAMLSDLHIDEPVESRKVNGLNTFNLAIAEERFRTLGQSIKRATEIAASTVTLDRLVVWLGGDGFSGDIHPDTEVGAVMRPLEAATTLGRWYRGLLLYLHKQLNVPLTVVCSYGNHGRLTKKPRVLLASETNLEWYLYHHLRDGFVGTPGIEFVIAAGQQTYLDVYGAQLRFQHGDGVKYQGGIGGITIPLNKAIAGWNTARKADLDILGHWHQRFDGGNFLVNGSLIGYSPYSMWIKAGYERPQQSFFVWDADRGKTITMPLFVDSAEERQTRETAVLLPADSPDWAEDPFRETKSAGNARKSRRGR